MELLLRNPKEMFCVADICGFGAQLYSIETMHKQHSV